MLRPDITIAEIEARLKGRFQNLQELGRGGHGEVYKAHALNAGLEVALKVTWVRRDSAHDEIMGDLTERFRREFEILLQLSSADSPVVRPFRHGEERGFPDSRWTMLWYSMELCGTNLTAELPRLTVAERVLVVVQLLSAVSSLHGRLIAHRDLKPDNVFLVRRPGEPLVARLGDLGIARGARPGARHADPLTALGYFPGTARYLAPEVGDPEYEVDLLLMDQFAAGMVCFEALSGGPPWDFGQGTDKEIVRAKRKAPRALVIPGFSGELRRVQDALNTMLRRDPSERFDSVHAAADELREAMRRSGLPVPGDVRRR